jgi:energy-coupling factor transport system ATP-binding protein
VAIAGSMVMEPDIIILDEATSMLDPDGRREVLDIVSSLHARADKTIIMVTHYIEETLNADRIILMGGGRVLASGTPREILTDEELLAQAGLMVPFACRVYRELLKKGIELERCPLTEEELVELICR